MRRYRVSANPATGPVRRILDVGDVKSEVALLMALYPDSAIHIEPVRSQSPRTAAQILANKERA